MGQKRTNSEMADQNSSSSPFMPMFETFRKELDEHHDRRERCIKASRDITAASKKIVRKLGQPIPQPILKNYNPFYDTIRKQYVSASADLQGLNAHRYARNITSGNQEFMEAVSFEHYLVTQSLLSYTHAAAQLRDLGGEGGPIDLSPEDYLLGIFDMTGELMRFAITSMATNGKLPGADAGSGAAKSDVMDVDGVVKNLSERNVLTDMRQLRTSLESLDIAQHSPFGRDVEKKMEVMRTCVGKVENALYGLVIRGRERPKGWMPPDEGRREEVEGF
ncbi:hypothetical protein LTR28_004797 [Elasticomyces elasticus]|nr:hypothetical protein LTR28_004797 [Elasticomyces elasticus]